MYATTERVDRLKEDLDAVSGTVAEVLGEQRGVTANLRAIMTHFGVQEVAGPVDPEDA